SLLSGRFRLGSVCMCYWHLPFLDRGSVSSDKAPLRSASQAGPELTPVRKTRLVHWVGLLMIEIMNQLSELVAILRRDKFVLALSAPLASFDAAESVACLQWVTDTCGVAFFKHKKEQARRETATWMPFVVIMAKSLHL